MTTTRLNILVLLRSFFLYALAIGLLDIQLVASQVVDHGKRNLMLTFFELNLDGTLSRGHLAVSTMDPEQDLLITVLENEITRKDLGLNDEKWNLIKRDFDAAKGLLEKYTNIVRQRKVSVEETEDFKRGMEQYLEAIRGALTEEQWNRIQQLGVRFSMREAGPSMSIFTGKLGEQLEIPMKDRSAVATAGFSLVEPLRKESRELKTQAIERLMNLLTPDHRTELEEYFKRNKFQPENINFGILVWQLGYQSESEEKPDATTVSSKTAARNDIVEEFQELEANSTFKLSIAGTFEPAGTAIRKKGYLNFKLIELLIKPDVAKPLELSDEQIATFKDAWEAYLERSHELDLELQYAEDLQKVIPRIRTAKAEALEKLDGLVEKVLLPQQIEWLKEYAGRVGVSRIGLVGSLVDGQLGRMIGITEQEKKALRQEAPKIRDELMKKSLELEDAIYDKLIAVLSDEDAKRLKSLIGVPMKEGYANLDVLADQLSGMGNN